MMIAQLIPCISSILIQKLPLSGGEKMSIHKDDLKRDKDLLSSTYTPNQRYVPGGSVDEHRDFEAGNIILTGDEIKQQNENL